MPGAPGAQPRCPQAGNRFKYCPPSAGPCGTLAAMMWMLFTLFDTCVNNIYTLGESREQRTRKED